jgi:NTP pyrophosphatase (non-canonical NTP hydrolase)
MQLNFYQRKALASKVYGAGSAIIYPTLKLAGEAGEVAEKVGKTLRDNDGVFTDEIKLAIAQEIGDVLWYCAALSSDLGFDLNSIAKMNMEKLADRKKRNKIHGSGDNR